MVLPATAAAQLTGCSLTIGQGVQAVAELKCLTVLSRSPIVRHWCRTTECR